MSTSLRTRSAALALASALILSFIAPACSSNSRTIAPQDNVAVGPQVPVAGSSELEAQLTAELYRQLEAAGIDPGARNASSLPAPQSFRTSTVGHRMMYTDNGSSLDPLCVQLRMVHRLQGDFDGNGEVNASDIAPLARLFRETVEYVDINGELRPAGDPFESQTAVEDWQVACADGDGNGEVNGADIASIVKNWGVTVTEYDAYRRVLPDGEFQHVVRVPGSSIIEGNLHAFIVDDLVLDSVDVEYVVAPVGADPAELASTPVATKVDLPSVVVVTPDEPEGEAPHTVIVDASPTTDPNSAEVVFDWDIVGIDEEPRVEKTFADPATMEFTFEEPGTYQLRVSVKDTDGGEAVTPGYVEVVVTEPTTGGSDGDGDGNPSTGPI